MAYVRRRGSQLAVVHGFRNKANGKVEQQILFTIYSKAEALHILGRNGREKEAEEFKGMMRRRYPDIRFNWKKLLKGFEDDMGALPDLYEYREKRLLAGFKEDLKSFLRRLVETDPRTASGAPLYEYRRELLFMRQVLDERLSSLDLGQPQRGSRFLWSEALTAPTIPPEIETLSIEAYESGDVDAAETGFRLLTECYPDYATGYCYLGRIAHDRKQLDEAGRLLELARRTAQDNLKKRKAERTLPVWDDDVLAQVEATLELARFHNGRQNHEMALALADELQLETLDPAGAAQVRAEVYLNMGIWDKAADAAVQASTARPDWHAIAAVAVYEMGDALEAATLYIMGLMNRGEVATALLAEKVPQHGPRPAPGWEVAASRLIARLGSFVLQWPRSSQAFFFNLHQFAIKEGILEQLETSLDARQRAGGLDAHRADEDVKWLRSSLFADQMARAFLGLESTNVEPGELDLEKPPQLMIPDRCFVASTPLKLSSQHQDSDDMANDAPILSEPMNLHAVLLPISLVAYWMERVGVFHSYVSQDAVNTMPEAVPALVLKGGASAARACNRVFRGVDSVSLVEGDEGETNVAVLSRGVVRGILGVVADDEASRTQLEVLLASANAWGGRLLLLFSAGGTRQQCNVVRVWDLAGAREVTLSSDKAVDVGASKTVDVDASESGQSWGLYGTFEVELEGIEPRVWRRFQLPLNGNFQDLHNAIQAACGWEDRHLFEFRLGENLGQKAFAASSADWDDDDPPPEARLVTLSEILHAYKPMTFWYTYDFGDSWRHRITLLEVNELQNHFQRRFLAGERAFPPEDCGGLGGFHECVEIAMGAYSDADLADDEDLRSRRTWLGDWHPEGFDAELAKREFDE